MSQDIFEQFANAKKEHCKKTTETISARYRGCGHSQREISGAASDVTRYIYEDGKLVGTEIIKVRRRRVR